MWGAGGAAAISPLPLLDLAAGSAVSVKMVVELAKVYRQDVDFEVAVNLLGQLGKNLLGILGVTAATPAVTAAVASLLKTVPGRVRSPAVSCRGSATLPAEPFTPLPLATSTSTIPISAVRFGSGAFCHPPAFIEDAATNMRSSCSAWSMGDTNSI